MNTPSTTTRKLAKLPEDLKWEIFTRLPVKTLLKIRCLNKESNSLILNRDFQALYIKHRLQVGLRKYLCRQLQQQKPLEIRETVTFNRVDKLYTPQILQDSPIDRVLCYVNGVLLIQLQNSNILLWNPSIGITLEIPCFLPGGRWNNILTKSNFGFGFDPLTKSYKVIALFRDNNGTKVYSKVYHLNTKSWLNPNQGSILEPAIYLTKYTTPINFNNQIMWLGSTKKRGSSELTHFLSFNLSQETFTLMELPGVPGWKYSAVLDNCLTVLDYDYVESGGKRGTLWKRVMSDSGYIWSKQYDMDIKLQIKGSWGSSFYKIEHWFRNLPEGFSSYYNLEEQELTTLSDIVDWSNVTFLDRYLESLVLLSEVNSM